MGITPGILNIISTIKDSVGIEIGVEKGVSSEKILQLENVKFLYGVDSYQAYLEPPSEIYKEGNHSYEVFYHFKKLHEGDISNFEFDKQQAIKVYNKYSDRSKLIMDFAHKAIPQIPEKVDFTYVDANHQYEYVLEDLRMSYDKVKEGGYIFGDDYTWDGGAEIKIGDKSFAGRSCGQVEQAVKDFCNEKGLTYTVYDDGQFSIQK